MHKVHYQLFSTEQGKPWVMLIHGLFGNLDNLSAIRRKLTHDFNIIAVDLLDHGQSCFSQTFSFEQNAQAIIKLIKELELTKLAIVGHSLGGKVAMQIALSEPELVSLLVVLDIAPVKYPSRHDDVFKGLKNVPLDSLTSRKEADEALAEYVDEVSTRQFLLKSLYQQQGQWCWRFNLDLLHKDYPKLTAALEHAGTYQGPVLFLKGALSDYILLEHKPQVLKLFPNSQSKIILDCGHWLHAEKPDICAKHIRHFLHK